METHEINTELVDAQSGEAMLATMERASIDMQVSTAKKYPRVISKVKDDMMTFATVDEETAASCFYKLPRGDKKIEGESVRLAEIAASCYGNMRIGSRAIEVVSTGDSPHVIVQAVAHDLEKNVLVSIEKRRRITKKKSKTFVDEDDIQLAVNACAAIAFREAVFKVVPKAIVRPIFLACKRVAIGDIRSLAKKRQEVIERLIKMGADQDRIFAAVGVRKIDDIDIEKLEDLVGIGTSLKDGAISLEEAFPAPQAPEATVSMGAATQAPTEPKPAPKAEEPKPEAKKPEPAPKQAPQPTKDDSPFAEPEKTATAPTKAPAQESTDLTPLDKLTLTCEQYAITLPQVLVALKKINRVRPSVAAMENVLDETVEWAEKNFKEVYEVIQNNQKGA